MGPGGHYERNALNAKFIIFFRNLEHRDRHPRKKLPDPYKTFVKTIARICYSQAGEKYDEAKFVEKMSRTHHKTKRQREMWESEHAIAVVEEPENTKVATFTKGTNETESAEVTNAANVRKDNKRSKDTQDKKDGKGSKGARSKSETSATSHDQGTS